MPCGAPASPTRSRSSGGPGREETPADLADGPGQRGGPEGELADRASDAVGGDDEIVIATGSVAELDGDDAALVSDAVYGHPRWMGHVARRLEQQFVQVGPMKSRGMARRASRARRRRPRRAAGRAGRGSSAAGSRRPGRRRAPRGRAHGERERRCRADTPVPEGRHAGSRSITSTATPARASIGASAKPAIPPPTIRTRFRLTASPTVVHDIARRDRRRDLADLAAGS